MKMKVLALCSQKGGVGKTTLCGHLGVEAEIKGHGPVALIDTDPQGSLASWWNEREAPEPVFAQVQIANLAEHLRLLDEAGIKLAIIDTTACRDMIEQVMAVADLILIPTRPSPHDLRAVGSTSGDCRARGQAHGFRRERRSAARPYHRARRPSPCPARHRGPGDAIRRTGFRLDDRRPHRPGTRSCVQVSR